MLTAKAMGTDEAQPGDAKQTGEAAVPAAAAARALIAEVEAAGVGVNEAAAAWLSGVEAALATPGEFETDAAGLGGHELALLDFDPAAAERLRAVGRCVGVRAGAGVIAALAIAGSAAQSRAQPFPADLDFFERVHIAAPSREEAVATLARVVRGNVRDVERHPGFALRSVHFGTPPSRLHPVRLMGRHGSLVWQPADIARGEFGLTTADGAVVVAWEEAAADPGFVKLDWVLNRPSLGEPGPIAVSKVIDPTWQRPDGGIVSLDGLIDADYQQVYLGGEDATLAAALTRGLSAADRAYYLDQIAREVRHYCETPPNYVKAAKRLYNLCRHTARYAEALYIRELFDEPPARLAQSAARLKQLVALHAGQLESRGGLPGCLDELADVAKGETAILDALATCRGALTDARSDTANAALTALVAAIAEHASREFERQLRVYPPTAALIAEIVGRGPDS